MTTVLIVDDHPVFRRGLAALLRASGIDVVGEAANAEEAVSRAAELAPDVVLMDLGLPDRHGLDATRRILDARPDARIVVVTMFDDDDTVATALAVGAIGYVVKDSAPEQIVTAVRAAELGASLLSAGLQRPALAPRAPHDLADQAGLTRREAAVLGLLAEGLSNTAIAQRLSLSNKTIANYVSTVLVKLGARDRRDAERMVREARSR